MEAKENPPARTREGADAQERTSKLHLAALIAAAGALVAVLAVADAATFPDAAPSPLYRATLDQAYSRFRETDLQMAAGRRREPRPAGEGEAGVRPAAAGGSTETDVECAEYREGERLAKEGRDEEAAASFGKALARFPRSTTIRHRLADLQNRMGRWREAVNAYRELLQQNHDQTCCFEHLADIFAQQGQPEMAARMLDNAAHAYEAKSRQPEPAGTRGKWDLASFRVKRGRELEDALRLAQELVASREDEARLFLLAECYEKLGRLDEARATADRIRTDDPESARILGEFRGRIEAVASEAAPAGAGRRP